MLSCPTALKRIDKIIFLMSSEGTGEKINKSIEGRPQK